MCLALSLTLAVCSVAHAAHFGYRPLQKGTVGEDVEQLQWMLQSMGYYEGEVDGVFGSMMQDAIKRMQLDYGLPDTGRVEGRLLEISRLLWDYFITSEFEMIDLNPRHLEYKGNPQLYVHTVQPGDTLYALAMKYATDIELIVGLNKIPHPDRIYVGERLFILAYR